MTKETALIAIAVVSAYLATPVRDAPISSGQADVVAKEPFIASEESKETPVIFQTPVPVADVKLCSQGVDCGNERSGSPRGSRLLRSRQFIRSRLSPRRLFHH